MKIQNRHLERLRIEHLAPARRALAAAWSWWIAELLEMLPDNIRTLLGKSNQNVFLVPGASEVAALTRTDAQGTEIARIPLDASTETKISDSVRAQIENGIAVLPAGKALVKRITLPAATEENLRGVLEFQMDRETPFSAEQVYFDARVVARSGQTRTIDVDLVLAPRTYLEDLLKRLSLKGIHPSAATAKNRNGEVVEVNLLPRNLMPTRPPLMNTLNKRLALAACLLLAAAVTLPILHKTAVIAELTPRVEAARSAAQEGSRIRNNIEQLHAAAERLVARKSTDPMIIEMLDATSRAVPDHTWIAQFEVDGRRIRIAGESSIAASLIEMFDQSTAFANPEFSAPVTRLRNSDREKFDLSIKWPDGDGS